MSNKTFDTLRLLEAVFVPLITFAIAMTDTWGFAHAAQIAATLAALNVCFGAVLEGLRQIYLSQQ